MRKVDVGVVEELLWQQLAAIMHQPNLKPVVFASEILDAVDTI